MNSLVLMYKKFLYCYILNLYNPNIDCNEKNIFYQLRRFSNREQHNLEYNNSNKVKRAFDPDNLEVT